jgi:light-regulated signal transduction histidine kinase (bacteriophytochrome)
VWINLTISLMREETGEPKHFIAVIEDISDRKLLEQELRRLNTELEERVEQRTAHLTAVNQELEAFSYSVSHDLRAPLRSIDGFSLALLEDYADKVDADGQDYLNRIRASSQRMGQLIDDMIELSRINRGDIHYDTVNLSQLAQDVIASLQERDPSRDIAISIQDEMVTRGDSRLLRVLLENLLGNSCKFTSKEANAQIEFGLTTHDGEPAYYVRDNGAGFDMKYVDKLFGAFQRLHSAVDFEGTGIGLATCKRVVHRHGGSLWAEAEVGQGATFYFTL